MDWDKVILTQWEQSFQARSIAESKNNKAQMHHASYDLHMTAFN